MVNSAARDRSRLIGGKASLRYVGTYAVSSPLMVRTAPHFSQATRRAIYTNESERSGETRFTQGELFYPQVKTGRFSKKGEFSRSAFRAFRDIVPQNHFPDTAWRLTVGVWVVASPSVKKNVAPLPVSDAAHTRPPCF